jgi:hypothetical protein
MRSAAFIIISLLAGNILAQWYPQIDNSYWEVDYFGSGVISGVTKKVRTSSTTVVDKMVFYRVSLHGVRVNGQYYTTTADNEWTSTSSDYISYYGYHNVDGISKRLGLQYHLHKDGKFRFQAFWTSYSIDNTDQIILRVDYDLDGSADDIVEHTMQENSVDQWFGPSNETTFSLGAFPQAWDAGIENNSPCRIADASSPTTQFYATFWPYAYRPVDFNFNTYASDSRSLPPTTDPTVTLQTTHDNANYQQYAYSGRDQVMYLTLNFPDQTQCQYCSYLGIHGKVFQKPNGRSLRVYNYVMQGAWTPNLNQTVDNGRSVSDALNDLTDNRWTLISKTGLPNPYGNVMTRSQVHDFMLNSRDDAPNTYSTENRENFRDWHVEVPIIDCFIEVNNGGAWGVMFDHGGDDNNDVSREGAVVSWRRCEYGGSGTYDDETTCLFTFIHEAGHCFNFQHTWSDCGTNFNSPACAANNRTIMSYGPLHGGCTMTWGADNQNWYQQGPESWVKPGRYGTLWFATADQDPPTYHQY